MAVVKIEETVALKNMFMETITACSAGRLIAEEDTILLCIKSTLMGMADYAAVVANKETPVYVVIPDLKGNNLLAAKVEWIPGDGDEEDTGNFTIGYTFDEITDNLPQYKLSDPTTYPIIVNRAALFHLKFNNGQYCYYMAVTTAMVLKQWLDDNAKPDDPAVLRMEGFFEAKCEFKGDKKVYSIIPYGYLKTPVKNDAGVQK